MAPVHVYRAAGRPMMIHMTVPPRAFFRSLCVISISAAAACGGATTDSSVQHPDTTGTNGSGLENPAGGWRELAVGDGQSCGIAKSGLAYCWGKNSRYELGDSTDDPRSVPTRVASPEVFTHIYATRYLSCGLAQSGDAYCWGYLQARIPTRVGGGHHFSALAVTWYHVCGIELDGSIWCWSSVPDASPSVPEPLPGNLQFQRIAGGEQKYCGITRDAVVYCWLDGVLTSDTLVKRQAVDARAIDVAVGSFLASADYASHQCAVLADSTAACWGDNGFGQLGDGTVTTRTSATPVVGGKKFTAITAAWTRTCAVEKSGQTYCWGSYGVRTAKPLEVLPGIRIARVAISTDHACLVTPGGAAFCWGNNDYGQLGTGDAGASSFEPRRVIDP